MWQRMKWVLSVGLAVGLLGGALSAYADRTSNLPNGQQGTFETTVAIATTDSLGTFGPGSIIYGASMIATTAGGWCALIDSATSTPSNTTQGVIIDDLSEATQYDRNDSSWPAPYRVVTDLSVTLASCTWCAVYHDPQ